MGWAGIGAENLTHEDLYLQATMFHSLFRNTNPMFNIMRQMNTKIDQKSDYTSEVFLFQFTNVATFVN